MAMGTKPEPAVRCSATVRDGIPSRFPQDFVAFAHKSEAFCLYFVVNSFMGTRGKQCGHFVGLNAKNECDVVVCEAFTLAMNQNEHISFTSDSKTRSYDVIENQRRPFDQP